MLTRLISTLDQLGIDTSPENVSDLLWLAQYQDAWEFSAERDAANANARTASALGSKAEQLAQPRSEADIDTSANAAAKNAYQPGTQPQSSAGANVLAHAGGASSGVGVSAVPFNSPGVPALPGRLALSRAMRSLHRRVPSRTAKRIDEIATVAQVANSGIWMPVLRAAPERWLDVILLVDESASMVIWDSTIREFKSLLEQQGAFRNVETWGLRTPTEGQPIELHAGFGQAATNTPIRDPRVLLDTTGQRLFLVVSDCVAPVWANGAAGKLLQTWSKHNLVALVQVLPLHLWDRTAMREWAQINVRATLAGTPNHQWEQRPIYEWLQEEADAVSDTSHFPIAAFTLEPHTLADWARCLVAGNGKWHRGYGLPTKYAAPPLGEAAKLSEEATPPSVSELVQQFVASASQEAIRLAGYLAAVPLTLPIMRMTQAVMLPHTWQVHLAEVFLSGLVRRITPQDQLGQPDRADDLEYDFVDGVRDIFTSRLPITETVEVLQRISEFVNQNAGQPIDFPALIADPTGTDTILINESNYRFATVAVGVLGRLGDKYKRIAEYLERELRSSDLESRHELQFINYLSVEQSLKSQTSLSAEKEYANLINIRNPFTSNFTSTGFNELSVNRLYVPTLSKTPPASSRKFGFAEFFSESLRIVILGDPGSGKTTLLYYIAHQLTQILLKKISTAQIDAWGMADGLVPFLVSLREVSWHSDLRNSPTVSSNALVKSIVEMVSQLGQPNANDFVNRHLYAGTGILLLDGYDEVIPSNRPRLAQAIRELASLFPLLRIVVTSRIVGFHPSIFGSSFYTYTIAEFDLESVKVLTRNWFQEMFRSGKSTAPNAEYMADSFLQSLQQNPKLAQLATSPLLLTTMLTIFTNHAKLPDQRVALFDEFTKLMLERWDLAKGIEHGLELSVHAIESALSKLAWVLLQSGKIDADEQDVLSVFAESLRSDSSIVLAKQALDLVQQRSGLLLAVGSESYRFIHQSVQEYFAARAILENEDNLSWVISDIGNPLWKEVIKFAVELESSRSRLRTKAILIALLDTKSSDRVILAAECMPKKFMEDKGLVLQILNALREVTQTDSSASFREQAKALLSKMK